MDESRRRAWEWLEIGPAWAPRSPVPASGAPASVPTSPADPALVAAGPEAPPASPGDIAGMDLATLRAEVAACTRCELAASRTQTVFGVGKPRARCMLIGEAPGAEEDRRGEPFVGRAGQLLDRMLAAIGCSRETDVFIANVLKCRPPGNRDPLPSEVACCNPFLARQVALVAPAVIVVLGRFAAQSLLATDASIASLRGQSHAYRVGGAEIPVVVTYHPAYLLRNPLDKGKAWRDLCRAAELLRTRAGEPKAG